MSGLGWYSVSKILKGSTWQSRRLETRTTTGLSIDKACNPLTTLVLLHFHSRNGSKVGQLWIQDSVQLLGLGTSVTGLLTICV